MLAASGSADRRGAQLKRVVDSITSHKHARENFKERVW